MSTLFAEFNRFRSLLGNLYEHGEANSISNLVFEELFHIPQIRLKLSGELEIKPEEKLRLDSILARLLGNEPVQYVLGFAWFMNDRFLVNEATLIPRPETEELVSWIAEEWKDQSNLSILDLGTGSGCIGISLQKKLSQTRLLAVDIHETAIHTARINAQQVLGSSDSSRFIVQDMLDPLWWNQQEQFDIIVSNPPYVRESEKSEMTPGVLEFEPGHALFVPDEDPLVFYRNIALPAREHLKPGGKLYFEINANLGQEMSEMLMSQGYSAIIKKDMQGKDRMLKAWLSDRES